MKRNKNRSDRYHLILRTITNTIYGYNIERTPEYESESDPVNLFYFGDFVILPENTLSNRGYIYVYPAKVLRDLIGDYTINVLDTSAVVPRYTSICTFVGNIQVSLFLPMHTQFIGNHKQRVRLQIRDAQFSAGMLLTYSEYLRR